MFTKHYDSYQKNILMCSHKYLTIKPVYTTLCLYTKKYQRSQCVYKTLRFISKKDPDVFSQNTFFTNILCSVINPSNYKTCLYNFVFFTQKNTKDPNVFTKHYDSYPKKILMCSHKTLMIHQTSCVLS